VALVQRRIGVIFATGFALLALAGARTLYLGALQGSSLRKAARTQQLTYEAVPAQRGTISDRSGIDLAVSEPAQDIAATPYLLKDPLTAAQRLAPLLGQGQDAVLRKLSERTGFVYLACIRAGSWPRRCSGWWAPKATASRVWSTRATRCCTVTRASAAW
jgi:cell division protein FtsI/penicillin-binding protein 2